MVLLFYRYLGGGTYIAEALYMARNQMLTYANGRRSDALAVVLLVTDGMCYSFDLSD